ncbi:PKD domain protein [Kordia sp. SMS9]|uniref:PKD domain-containing protein n=1 Tax=Kordia sp. SMS9 TaxID=2282170 RepID=UPI000E10476B|nr:PKD domain-containing protein [Kordia sp. SMS9]AXG71413.1 PKD domain protein [Kordia sp. SMS9]
MKAIKYVFSICLIALIVFSCEDDENLDFVDTANAPTNLSLLTEITQDNTGLVKITPLGEGVTSYNLNLGDGSDMVTNIAPGAFVENTYAEGTYDVTLIAKALNGDTTTLTQQIVVSFQAPQNLVVTIENDPGISKQVNITATADFAMSNQINFGDGSEVVTGNIGETISHIYDDPGIYTITLVAMGGAIETTTYTEDFEVTAIVAPLASAPAQPARADGDVISIFSSAYNDVPGTNYFPDWGQGGQGSSWALFDLGGDEMLQYINLSYQGIALADGTSVDVSGMEFLHLDVWTADVVTDIEVSLINNPASAAEAPVTRPLTADSWTTIEIPISEYVDQGLSVNEIFQLKFVGTPWAAGTVFIDNIYFYKEPSQAPTIAGTWKVAPVAGSLAVGPTPGSGDWFSISDAQVAERACFYDDTYVFGTDGSFANVLGADTWIEGWQSGSADACGAPIAPHNGGAATYTYNDAAGTVTINGTGSYLGIPKATNTGEISTPGDAPSSITYNVTLDDINNMTVEIEAGGGVFWTYKLVREGDVPSSPLAGSWSVAPEAGSLAVGPTPGSGDWFSISDAQVAERACFYDDEYVFGNDGSFANVLGTDTWIEGWQSGSADACGAPIAPHDGTPGTFVYDAVAGTVTINGTGSYLGIPKATNTGEIANPADAPSSITYDVTFIDDNTITVQIEAGGGVFWTYKLIKN